MLLLAIVFIGWVRMNNIQAVNKESLRFAAIEKAAGMLETIDANRLNENGLLYPDTNIVIQSNGDVSGASEEDILPLFDSTIPLGYRCHVEGAVSPAAETWGTLGLWISMELFERNGSDGAKHAVAPFSTLRLFCTQ